MQNLLFPDYTFPDSSEFPFSVDYGKYGNVIYDDILLGEDYYHFSLNADLKINKGFYFLKYTYIYIFKIIYRKQISF